MHANIKVASAACNCAAITASEKGMMSEAFEGTCFFVCVIQAKNVSSGNERASVPLPRDEGQCEEEGGR